MAISILNCGKMTSCIIVIGAVNLYMCLSQATFYPWSAEKITRYNCCWLFLDSPVSIWLVRLTKGVGSFIQLGICSTVSVISTCRFLNSRIFVCNVNFISTGGKIRKLYTLGANVQSFVERYRVGLHMRDRNMNVFASIDSVRFFYNYTSKNKSTIRFKASKVSKGGSFIHYHRLCLKLRKSWRRNWKQMTRFL